MYQWFFCFLLDASHSHHVSHYIIVHYVYHVGAGRRGRAVWQRCNRARVGRHLWRAPGRQRRVRRRRVWRCRGCQACGRGGVWRRPADLRVRPARWCAIPLHPTLLSTGAVMPVGADCAAPPAQGLATHRCALLLLLDIQLGSGYAAFAAVCMCVQGC